LKRGQRRAGLGQLGLDLDGPLLLLPKLPVESLPFGVGLVGALLLLPKLLAELVAFGLGGLLLPSRRRQRLPKALGLGAGLVELGAEGSLAGVRRRLKDHGRRRALRGRNQKPQGKEDGSTT